MGNTESSAATNAIVMYTTRFCPFCVMARSLIERKGWEYSDIPVDGNPRMREEMREKSGRHTVPQIWIGDRHIGGCDELMMLERAGELDSIVMGAKS